MPRSMSRRSLRERFEYNCHPEPMSGCVLWGGKTRRDGYGTLMNKGKWLAAHRVAWELAGRGPLAPSDLACHKCDNRVCVNVDHIFIGSYKDNIHDCWAKGRGRLGARGREKKIPRLLDAECVVEVLGLLRSGLTYKAVAQRSGISESSVGNIKAGRHRRVV
jgi:hypothetical protein